ncbi:hypothetical protein GA0115240_141617 [Streptomyces sp. DvalAA-14]|nr:hypothetical protein GA0115240_141617 [Streptomyces sp. DvalAA-14]
MAAGIRSSSGSFSEKLWPKASARPSAPGTRDSAIRGSAPAGEQATASRAAAPYRASRTQHPQRHRVRAVWIAVSNTTSALWPAGRA